jgi:hypothetical protein
MENRIIQIFRSEKHKKFILECSEIFEKPEIYGFPEKAVNEVFNKFKNTKDPVEILIKVVVLNSLYSTSIYNTQRLAKSIFEIKNFQILSNNDSLELINKIRKGHKIINNKTGRERDLYSFATKYCSFHNPEKYPIYDNIIKDLFNKLKKEKILDEKFSNEEMYDYPRFKILVNNIMEKFDFKPNQDYKKFDQGMWIIGKYLKIINNKKYPSERDKKIEKEVKYILRKY